MHVRFLASVVAVMAVAGSAIAQSPPVVFGTGDLQRTPQSFEEPWSNTTAGVTFTLSLWVQPKTANGRRSQFVITRSGAKPQIVGLCIANVEPLSNKPTKAQWAAVIDDRVRDPEGRQRALTTAEGDNYIRHLGSRPLTSQTGWAGYFYAWDRSLKATGQESSMVSATTLLDETARLVLLCRSDPGFSFTPADIDAIFKFARSARRA